MLYQFWIKALKEAGKPLVHFEVHNKLLDCDFDSSFTLGVCKTGPLCWLCKPWCLLWLYSSYFLRYLCKCTVLLHVHCCIFLRVCMYCTWVPVAAFSCHPHIGINGRVPKAQCCHRISSHMIMWEISMIGCHWFHWHLSPQWDELQHELLKTYACRSVSWLRQTIRFATLQRAEESHVDSCFNPFWQSVSIFQAQELSGGL